MNKITVKTILELKESITIINDSIEKLKILRTQLKNNVENLKIINNYEKKRN